MTFNNLGDGLRKAREQEFIVRWLLAHAEYYRYQQSWKEAWVDLEEAREIAERGEMRRWLCDYHLEAGRLCGAQGDIEGVKEHYEEAKRLVEECGYHRRDGEVRNLGLNI